MKKEKKLLKIGAWTLLAAVLLSFHAISGTGNSESLAASSQGGEHSEEFPKQDRDDDKEAGRTETEHEEMAGFYILTSVISYHDR